MPSTTATMVASEAEYLLTSRVLKSSHTDASAAGMRVRWTILRATGSPPRKHSEIAIEVMMSSANLRNMWVRATSSIRKAASGVVAVVRRVPTSSVPS